MKSLNEILAQATREHWAVPHFNFSTLDQLIAITETCGELRSPVMVGTSESEREFVGPLNAVALIKEARRLGISAFLNADHTKSVVAAKKAIDSGYTSIHIDLSKLPFSENQSGVEEIVAYAKLKEEGTEFSIEGEVGYLPTESSRVYKETISIDPASLTDPDEAEKFVLATGVNRFAPAVGNIHGIAANEPNIDVERILQIRSRLPQSVSLVLHGGSGIKDQDMRAAIKAGIANIHISTELRRAWKEGLIESVSVNADEYAPYKILEPAINQVKKLVREKINLFGSADKA